MEASHAVTVEPTAKSHTTAPRHAEGAASNSPEAATRVPKSTAAPRKRQPTHACRPTGSATHRPWRGKGPRHQVTAGIRKSRGSTSQSLAKWGANGPTSFSTKGVVEERMVREDRVGADCTSHDYTGWGCKGTTFKSSGVAHSAGRCRP